MRTTRSLLTVTLGVLAALALAGCGGSGGDASSAGADNSAPKVASQPAERGAPDAGGSSEGSRAGSGTTSGQAADAASFEQRVVRTADMAVQTNDVPAAVVRVRGIAETAKGFVAGEQTTTSPTEPRPVERGSDPAPPPKPWSQSVLTLRVPNASLDRVMQQIGDLGSVTSRNQSSQDVTGKYVDTASRVRSQTASVERVRALLSQAKDLGQIVQIEGELARREADLESLKSQLAALDDQTTLSTLTVTITPHETAAAPTSRDNAFVSGLHAGWTALAATGAVLLAVVGALLPFAVVVAVLGLPVLWWLRRQRRRRAQAPAATV
ncbi:DUF4349 domain-containing protein [Angustibacter sp. Root456]|uniref:DUF4349 domain-containing protein n=1 Tax=Angustibacter sp. Root456 TaxID=1736539 RepID=UPI00138F6A69|nr:DUF4349 domain-containing protein [Angustibacter sp. Root456]